MTFKYYLETDMLYIELVKKVSIESEEVAAGIVLDFDEYQNVIGIEIEDAGRRIDLTKLEVTALPFIDFVFKKAA
ncbi:MAG: DUF2283 domain-containing protein [Desulfobacterales bacterium]|nr:DUF2283 domain-containing protein [Desulfobacterales bacterium]